MIDLRSLDRHNFSSAKKLWAVANVLKFLTFALGIFAIFLPWYGEFAPYVVFIFVVGAELVQWRSDIKKNRSEALLRKLDYCKSFGGKVSEVDKRDIALHIPRSLRKNFEVINADTYFDSSMPVGPRRAIENLAESAWYSRELAKCMAAFSVITIVVVLTSAICFLIFAVKKAASSPTIVELSGVVTAWLLLIFSLGLFRNMWGYCEFKESADRSYKAACHLLTGKVTHDDARTQWHEYQISRASSPLIPDRLWKWKEGEINASWNQAKE